MQFVTSKMPLQHTKFPLMYVIACCTGAYFPSNLLNDPVCKMGSYNLSDCMYLAATLDSKCVSP